jgi:hypothetical protein
VTPIEIACRHTCRRNTANCGAEAGEPCDWSKCIGARPGFHSERIDDAAAMARVENNPISAADLDRFVEEMGVV